MLATVLLSRLQLLNKAQRLVSSLAVSTPAITRRNAVKELESASLFGEWVNMPAPGFDLVNTCGNSIGCALIDNAQPKKPEEKNKKGYSC